MSHQTPCPGCEIHGVTTSSSFLVNTYDPPPINEITTTGAIEDAAVEPREQFPH